jgi:hypothetical protein
MLEYVKYVAVFGLLAQVGFCQSGPNIASAPENRLELASRSGGACDARAGGSD